MNFDCFRKKGRSIVNGAGIFGSIGVRISTRIFRTPTDHSLHQQVALQGYGRPN
jgi:hypothetical protein